MKTNIQALYRSEGYRVESIITGGGRLQVKLLWDERFKPCCLGCGSKMRINRKSVQSAMDLPFGLMPTLIDYDAVQGYCNSCNTYSTVRPLGIIDNGKATLRLMQFVSALCRWVPARRIPELLGLSGASAWRYDRYILQTQLPAPRLDGLEAILVDEKYLGKRSGFVTVVLNARSGELLFLGEGKSQESLAKFLDILTPAQKASIVAVGIDRSNAYRAAIEAHLPGAEIVFDKFHLVANYNEVIDAVRRRSLAEANTRGRKFIKGMRYILFRNPENLTLDDRADLDRLLAANSEIEAAYLLKDYLKIIWTYSSRQWAERTLLSWVKIGNETGVPEIMRFARGLLKVKDQVLTYIKHRITSARIEAFNRTIARVIYKTCGVSNMSYLFLKLRQESLQN